jgi:hypothetical protein
MDLSSKKKSLIIKWASFVVVYFMMMSVPQINVEE